MLLAEISIGSVCYIIQYCFTKFNRFWIIFVKKLFSYRTFTHRSKGQVRVCIHFWRSSINPPCDQLLIHLPCFFIFYVLLRVFLFGRPYLTRTALPATTAGVPYLTLSGLNSATLRMSLYRRRYYDDDINLSLYDVAYQNMALYSLLKRYIIQYEFTYFYCLAA